MPVNRITFYSFLAIPLAAVALAAGCTGDKNGQLRQVVVQQKAQADACPAEASRADKAHRAALDATQLPEGLYLYAGAEMRVEGRPGPTAPSIVVAETPATPEFQSRVECVTRVDGETLDASLNGLTKIELGKNGESSVTVRQFQAFIGESSHGLAALNPRLQQPGPVKTLGDFLSSAAASGSVKFFREESGRFTMQVERETDEQRSRLTISYDHIAPM